MATECFLIDDDLDDQEIFLMALREVDQDIQGIVANDGVEALARLRGNTNFRPEHIFLDVNMHRMNGLQCLPEIRKLHHLDDTRVIMYSTSSDAKIMEQCKDLGANYFLVKPARLSLLIESLNSILKERIYER